MNISILKELAEIEDFVRTTSKEEDVLGFNVLVSKHPGKSYVLAKGEVQQKAKYVLPVQLDNANPIHRPLIANAIHRGMYGEELSPEAMENAMVEMSDDIYEN